MDGRLDIPTLALEAETTRERSQRLVAIGAIRASQGRLIRARRHRPLPPPRRPGTLTT